MAAGKLLAYLLRHEPHAFGVVLDAEGWTDVETLLARCREHGQPISLEELLHEVHHAKKRRFEVDEDGRRIRALQGHSVAVELGLVPACPPDHLYHGTVTRALEAIRSGGLQKMDRRHVHLSIDRATATDVGARRGRPLILVIAALKMHADGYTFFRADNGVWLTDHVPPAYITFPP